MTFRKRTGIQKMKRIAYAASLLVCCFLFIQVDCTETLPLYNGPENIFALGITTAFPNPGNIQLDLDQQILGHKKLTFEIDLINIYEETLADSAQFILGDITLWWDDDPNVQATLPVKTTDEILTTVFDYPQYVIMDPGDSARFSIWWKYCKDDLDRYMWEYLDDIWYSEGDEGNILTNYGPMDFSVQAKLQPFPRGPAVYSNIYHMSVTFFTNLDI
jgi:hypothetical protein